jgi:outer membrane receptor for ferrienterochelin and colicins
MYFSFASPRVAGCVLALAFVVLNPGLALAQYTYSVRILEAGSAVPIPGATASLSGTELGASADAEGLVLIQGIPGPSHEIIYRSVGYEEQRRSVAFPQTREDTVYLQPAVSELDAILIQGTRSNRSIARIPTRVEVLLDEIDESAVMDPSRIAHLITHTTGMQVQSTSATSNTANVRMQGLDGRYTQILQDGFPLYGGFSSSLSIMQIPPLDLRQVEIIKGGASTLYGGGAISGLINLLSKDARQDETLLHLNASHLGAADVNAFISRSLGKNGFTLLAQRNSQRAFDADSDGFTDLAATLKYNLNPRVFFTLSERTDLMLGATLTEDSRKGGDMTLLDGAFPDTEHFYQERNQSTRITAQTRLGHRFSDSRRLEAKASFSGFQRDLSITPGPDLLEYRFAGSQYASFSELHYASEGKAGDWVSGLNLYTDHFRETPLSDAPLRDESWTTLGWFGQYTADWGSLLSVEGGLRTDYVLRDQLYALPRLALLFKWSPEWTTRITGGMGYRNPSVFNQEAEILGYAGVLPVQRDSTSAERSYGGNADLGYRVSLGSSASLLLNQMVFYTHLEGPLILLREGDNWRFRQADGHTRSYGTETFFKLSFSDFTFFAGYTYTRVNNVFSDSTGELTLTPRHSLKGDLLYHLPGRWRIGADYEFKSSQLLASGQRSPSFWTFGLMVEYTYRQFSLFGNLENFTDRRQSRYASMLSEPFQTPQLTEVWAPLEGFYFNGGIKMRW